MLKKQLSFSQKGLPETKESEQFPSPNAKGVWDLRGRRLTADELEMILKFTSSDKNIGSILWGDIPSGCEQLKADIEEALIQNNLAYRHYPNDYTHGLLSAAAYEENIEGSPLAATPNWVVSKIFNDKDSGFHAVLFQNNEDHQLVLAYRGLSFDIAALLKKDSTLNTHIQGVIGGSIVAQQANAFIATGEAISIAKAKGYNLSVTGHSIGAWLAELTVYYGQWDFEQKLKAVTFDSPGSVPMMQKFKANIESHYSTVDIRDFDITAYLSAPNLINSCNSHVGRKVFRLYPKLEPQSWLKKLQDLPVVGSQVGKAISPLTALAGNSLKLMLAAFDPISGKPKKYEEVLDWPVAKVNMEDFQTGVVEKAIELIPYSSYVPSFITSAIASKVSGFVAEYTSVSLINLLANLYNGNIDTEQYFGLFEYLDAEKGYGLRDELKADEKFTVTYESHYKVRPVKEFIDNLFKEKRAEDWFIANLKEYQKRLMASRSLAPVIKRQLELLLNEYEVKGVGADETINATKGASVDVLRMRVKRLLELYEDALNISLGRARRRSSVEVEGKLMSNLLERPQHFIGREDLFKQVHDFFTTRQVVVVSGFGGSGKSTFALEYCYASKATGKTVRWLSAESPDKLQIDYKNLAEELGISIKGEETEKITRAVNAKLNSFGNILLMFDNVEDYQDIKQYLLNLDDSVKVMVTTRRADIARENWGHIAMLPFTAKETENFMQARLGSGKLNSKDVSKLREKIGDLPQRLAIVLGFIADNGLTITDFLDLLGTDELKSFDEKQAQNLNKAMEIVVGNLITKDARAWEMLQYMAYLDADFVPRPLLKELGFNTMEWARAKKSLEALSLAREVTQDGIQGFRLHRLVQDDTKTYLKHHDTKAEERVLKKLGETLILLFPSVNHNPDETWRDSQLYLSSVNAILPKLMDMKEEYVMQILPRLGSYYRIVANNYKEALRVGKAALEMQEKNFAEDKYYLTNCLYNIGLAYLSLEDNKNALIYMEKCLTAQKELYASDDVRIGVTYDVLGQIYINLKNYDKALECCQTSLNIWQVAYPGGDVYIADIYATMGMAYSKLSKHDNAIDCRLKSLNIIKEYYSGNHLKIATATGMLADVYYEAGQKELALQYYEETLKIERAVLPANHINMAVTLEGIGCVYNDLKQQEKAMPYHQEALRIRTDFYQGVDMSVSNSWFNIAQSYRDDAVDHRESLESLGKSLSIIHKLQRDNYEEIYRRLRIMGNNYYLMKYRPKGNLYRKPQEYGVNNFAESFPLYKPDTAPAIFTVLEVLIAVDAVQEVAGLAEENRWLAETAMSSGGCFSCWPSEPKLITRGIIGHLQDDYLTEVLAEKATPENITFARCWLFDAINIGIARGNFANLHLATRFAEQFKDIVQLAAEHYPQFFVHKTIVEALAPFHRSTIKIMGLENAIEHKEAEFAVAINRDATLSMPGASR